jgi:hypothetical protein
MLNLLENQHYNSFQCSRYFNMKKSLFYLRIEREENLKELFSRLIERLLMNPSV